MITRFVKRQWYSVFLAPLLVLALAACSEQSPSQVSVATESAQTASTQAVEEMVGYRRINTPNEEDPLDAHIYELDNGLRVYLTENHEEPRFYAEIAVRAGSKHDPADATGLAHYLEHLLFKGNQNLGTLDYQAERPHLDRIVELYEEHFLETDTARRAEIYAEINSEAQQAAEYAVPNEIDKLYNEDVNPDTGKPVLQDGCARPQDLIDDITFRDEFGHD
ncbi:MAG: hypothetical protein CMQ15_09555, partial [Gammaproteobacteria bacterium]|nr:hypothetical protein [Gammaproteobacteria bacterium]